MEERHYVETLDIDERDVVLAVSPMSHAYAYGMAVMVPLLTGASLVATRRFNPTLVQRALAECNVTIFPAVPAMLDVLLIGAGGRVSSAPRCVLAAGSPLPERTRTSSQKDGHAARPLAVWQHGNRRHRHRDRGAGRGGGRLRRPADERGFRTRVPAGRQLPSGRGRGSCARSFLLNDGRLSQ